MIVDGEKINVSKNLDVDPLATTGEQARASLEQGFMTGAQHVHDAVGVLLATYVIELGVWAVAHFWADRFKSEEQASEFYMRVRRMLDSGRVVILLLIFYKTVFTFTSVRVIP